MAVDYAARALKAEEIHLYGFDSMFEMDLRSSTDLILESDRGHGNTFRLANNWRPVFTMIFKEFKNTQFYLYHSHDKIKIEIPKNVTIVTGGKK